MSRKIYIGENNLINLKNAMAGKNIGHSTFMQEDKPPYEKDEFTINPEGGANDNFHVNENASEELINMAIKYRPNEFSRWAVVIPSKPNLMPKYFEKKSLAIEFKKWYGNCFIIDLDKYDKLNENIENEVEANEVSLDSFKKQKELAPNIWNGDKLNSRVRLKLLDIADDFWETTDIGWVKPKGIVLMGSICNYNWSESSDIDLHLQVDFSEVDEKKDFVQEYFNGKKNEWNEEHSNLKIFGFPVELYVEDIDTDTNSGGIYDLEENDWIKKPSKDGIKQIGLDKYSIKDKSAKIMTDIDDLYDLFKKTDDDAKLRKIGEKAHDLLSNIKAMRKDGLSRGGESDKDNIVYKVLRRTGYMDILWNLSSQLYDKLNSIDESIIKESSDIFSYAKERFGVTNDIRECGYILPDGSMLDFSGRHMVTGDTSHLRGRRGIDHRDIGDLQWDKELKVRTNVNINMSDFIRSGAIRIHCSNTWSSINLFKKPTKQQTNVLIRLIQYSKGNVTVEIGDGDNSYEYAEWDDANPRRVINDIMRYFDGETVKLVGNVVENKIIKEYFNKYCRLNEEVVADGKYKTIIRHIIEEINRKKLVIEENGGQICDFSFIC